MLVNDVTIRFANAADVEFLTGQVHIAEAVVKRKVDAGEFVVAVSGDVAVGLLQLEYLWSRIPYIALIRVLDEHRRQGVGKLMLAFVENFLRENGHASLYSSSQADESEPQEWHRRVGFKECGSIREINDGIDEIFFCKSL